MIMVTVGATVTIEGSKEVMAPIIEALVEDLTYDNPEYHRMKALPQITPWRLNQIPRQIRAFHKNVEGTAIVIPRGAWARWSNRIPCTVMNVQNAGAVFSTPQIQVRLRPGAPPLFPYQTKAVNAIMQDAEGLVVAGCGSGKTVIGVHSIEAVRERTLILVHEIKLVEQWKAELRRFLDLEKNDIGEITGRKKTLRPITVATVQTLNKMLDAGTLDEVTHQFGFLLIDECHHTPARTVFDVVNHFPARYRIGLTATPYRKDKLDMLIRDLVGEVIYSIPSEELVEGGRITTATVRMIQTSHISPHESSEWTSAISLIVTDVRRNALIVELVAKNVRDEGRKVLVLSDRVEHCHQLCKTLRERGLKADTLLGETPVEERERVRKDTTIDVIVGTTVADEGLDVPWLDTIHLTCPCNNKGRVIQRVGRIRRVHEGKNDPVVYDYLDYGCAFPNVAKNRMRWYEAEGFEIERPV